MLRPRGWLDWTIAVLLGALLALGGLALISAAFKLLF